MYMGAIFMANRSTKQECFKRKLFGLPSKHAGFLKKIKAGTLLFLFEHEERKLYGVFEATSDGALNIMPNAFISSGFSFPAQIIFKRIWMCKPLVEDEFRDAIKENYFAPNKFHFGLSYEQVHKLIHLFSLTRIGLNQYRNPGIPNEIIEEFEKYGTNQVSLTTEGRPTEFNENEHSRDDGVDSERYPHSVRPYTNDSSSYENYIATNQASFGHESYKMPPRVSGPQAPPSLRAPHLVHPTSRRDCSIRRNFPAHRVHDHHGYHQYPASEGEILSDMDSRLFTPESMRTQDPRFRSQLHPSQAGSGAFSLSPSNYMPSSFPISDSIDTTLCPIRSNGHPDLRNSNDISHTEGYDPSSPRISFSSRGTVMAKSTDFLPLSHIPSNANVHAGRSMQESDPSGQQGLFGGPSDYIPLPENYGFDEDVESSHLYSSNKDSSCSYALESKEDIDLEELKPYLSKHDDEGFRIGARSRLRSDNEQSRASVFSRLTKAPDARMQYEGARKPVASLSPNQPLRILSRKKEQFDETRVSEQPMNSDDDEQFESVAEVAPIGADYLGELESSDDSDSEGWGELPFLNFKRRSEMQRMVGETEINFCAVSAEKKGNLGKYKRMRLVRPSLNEEEGVNVQAMQVSSQDIEVQMMVEDNEENNIGVQMMVEDNEENNTQNNELSTGIHISTQEIGVKTTVEKNEDKKTKNSELSVECHIQSHEIGVTTMVKNNDDKKTENRELCVGSHISSQEIGVKTVVENEGQKTVDSELLVGSHINTDNNSSASKICTGGVTTDKTEESLGGIKILRKEVSNRNLRWFLLKSTADDAKAGSVADHKGAEEGK